VKASLVNIHNQTYNQPACVNETKLFSPLERSVA